MLCSYRYCICVDDRTYATNKRGEGLFVKPAPGADWQQIEGTCQFRAATRAEFARKLRRRVGGIA